MIVHATNVCDQVARREVIKAKVTTEVREHIAQEHSYLRT